MSAYDLLLKIIKCYQIESLSLPTLHFFSRLEMLQGLTLTRSLIGSRALGVDEKSGLSQIQYQERAITVCLPDHCDNTTIMYIWCNNCWIK